MWYRISFNPDPDIMGCDTQVKNLHGDAREFKEELSEVTFRQVLDYEKVLDYVELKAKAKFTDILWDYSLQGRALFISEKTTTLLEQYKLLSAKFYPALVRKGAQIRNYYCLRLIGDISDKVNYQKSEFLWYKSDEGKDYLLTFSNVVDMVNKKKQVGPIDSIRAASLYLEDSFVEQGYDMIFLGVLGVGEYWINERLKKRLESEGLVGFTFNESGFIMNGGD